HVSEMSTSSDARPGAASGGDGLDGAADAGHPMTAHPESWIRERRWWILACLCLSLVLVVAGNSSLNVALPKIQADLGSAQSDLQWMVNAYGLVFAVLLLPAGALADRYGRKSALQLGMVIFG